MCSLSWFDSLYLAKSVCNNQFSFTIRIGGRAGHPDICAMMPSWPREQCLALPSVRMFDSVARATCDGRQGVWLGWCSSLTGRAGQLRAAVS
jgi:hypothetical protein